MARVMTCGYCGLSALNHDHDDCAEEYGEMVAAAILAHVTTKPTEPLPPSITEALQSEQWKGFLEYEKRQKRIVEIETHATALKEKIKRVVEAHLKDPEFLRKLNAECVPYEDMTFTPHLKVVVGVHEDPRF